jgi:hypothetical protein
MRDILLQVSICDGKYTIVQEANYGTKVLRYGEEWREVTGDNVILGAAYEIDELRKYIKLLEEIIRDLLNRRPT